MLRNEHKANDKEKFFYCLKHPHELSELPEGFTDGIWARLARQCEIAEMPIEVKRQYIGTMTTEIDKRAQLLYARNEGIVIGEKRGIAMGEERGIAKEKFEIARRLKSMGADLSVIAQATGLSKNEVSKT